MKTEGRRKSKNVEIAPERMTPRSDLSQGLSNLFFNINQDLGSLMNFFGLGPEQDIGAFGDKGVKESIETARQTIQKDLQGIRLPLAKPRAEKAGPSAEEAFDSRYAQGLQDLVTSMGSWDLRK